MVTEKKSKLYVERNISLGDKLFAGTTRILLVISVIVMVYPFYYSIIASISDNIRLVKEGNTFLWPRGFTMEAYSMLFTGTKIMMFYRNSILYSIGATALMLIVTTLTAYPLTFRNMPGRRVVSILFTIAMFLNGGLIPTYLWMMRLKLTNSPLVMIIPAAVNIWSIIIFKTFFQQLPAELSESAKIDGAGDFTILIRIVVPLSKPVISTFAIFNIVAVWNDFFTPLIYFRSPDLYPLQLFLRNLLVMMDSSLLRTLGETDIMKQFLDNRTVRSAAVIVAVLPIACLYPFFQKHFNKGIMVGSLKG